MKQITKTTGNEEWYTPAIYIESVRHVLGGIDIDPASCAFAQQTVNAGTYLTVDQNGLLYDWYGRVFLNPPYSSGKIGPFIKKLLSEYHQGNIKCYITLTNDALDTKWGQSLLQAASHVCFVQGRIQFNTPAGKKGYPPRGQCFTFQGPPDMGTKFVNTFSSFGTVLYGKPPWQSYFP